eukprot:7140750-Prymnesium_polylepis.1
MFEITETRKHGGAVTEADPVTWQEDLVRSLVSPSLIKAPPSPPARREAKKITKSKARPAGCIPYTRSPVRHVFEKEKEKLWARLSIKSIVTNKPTYPLPPTLFSISKRRRRRRRLGP